MRTDSNKSGRERKAERADLNLNDKATDNFLLQRSKEKHKRLGAKNNRNVPGKPLQKLLLENPSKQPVRVERIRSPAIIKIIHFRVT